MSSYLLQKIEAAILDCLERGMVADDGKPIVITETLLDDHAPDAAEGVAPLRDVRAVGERVLADGATRLSDSERHEYAGALLALYRQLVRETS